MTKLLIIEDQPVLIEGLKAIIKTTDANINVCGEIPCQLPVSKIIRAIRDTKADLIIIDPMQCEPGAIIGTISGACKRLLILTFSNVDECDYAQLIINSGAIGYVGKNADVSIIAEALSTVVTGKRYVSKAVIDAMISDGIHNNLIKENPRSKIKLLTERQLEVFELLGKGDENIHKILGITKKTVATHIGNIRKKFGFHKKSDVVRYAAEWFLVKQKLS